MCTDAQICFLGQGSGSRHFISIHTVASESTGTSSGVSFLRADADAMKPSDHEILKNPFQKINNLFEKIKTTFRNPTWSYLSEQVS